MKYEWLQLLKWIVLGNRYIYLIKWVINKIISKYSDVLYPEYIKCLPECVLAKCVKTKVSSRKVNSVRGGFNVDYIVVATGVFNINSSNIDWEKEWKDPEDEESLHRWNWSICKLSEVSEKDKEGLALWTLSQQENWIDKFQGEIVNNKAAGKLRWESYTVGERIANSVIFYHHILGGWSSVKLGDAIQDQVCFLIHNLEYFGKNTGNHVINNARAIYLAGVTFDCDEWRSLAFTIIKHEVPVVVTDDGFVREGSSHYQFLFTRWMLEVFYFALISNDDKMIVFLSSYLKLLIEQCHFFLTYNRVADKWGIPLFGDVSPDFPPEWLHYLPWSRLASSFVAPPDQHTMVGENCWNSLWNGVDLSEFNIKVSSQYTGQNTSIAYPKSGWFRVDSGINRLFYRVDPDLALGYVGHHHQDLYHFCLYRNGEPIFVDAGRRDYSPSHDSWGRFGISPRAHNSVIIDGVGSLPENSGRYPRGYVQTENKTEIQQLYDSVLITIKSTCFQRLISPVILTRYISLNSNSFDIEDELLGDG